MCLTQNKANFVKKLIITLVFDKLSKIAENCDHNIDLRKNICPTMSRRNSLADSEGPRSEEEAISSALACAELSSQKARPN
jgi:hypothetical protein